MVAVLYVMLALLFVGIYFTIQYLFPSLETNKIIGFGILGAIITFQLIITHLLKTISHEEQDV